jgi:23S rRNA (uracil1939-C5)-methyltransferase
MVCAVVNANGLVREDDFVKRIRAVSPEIKSIIINSNREKTNVVMGTRCRTAWGKDTINDILCGVKFELSPLSFYQVNRAQAEKLYERGREYAQLTGNEILFDIYCGIGTIGLSMAKFANQLYGIEIIPDAVENAKQNAVANGINNAEFICADAADGARQLKKRGISPNVVIIDPPRKGCSAEVIELINEMSPERVVYISCDPATLARDAAKFTADGWQVQKLTAVDMFPRTANVECVCLLTKVYK